MMSNIHFKEFLNKDENCIDFALWLFNRQTYTEQQRGETIEENMIGYNSPDAKALTPMMICLQDKVKFVQRDMILWVNNHLKPRLIKYEKQFKTYDSKKTSNRIVAK